MSCERAQPEDGFGGKEGPPTRPAYARVFQLAGSNPPIERRRGDTRDLERFVERIQPGLRVLAEPRADSFE